MSYGPNDDKGILYYFPLNVNRHCIFMQFGYIIL